MEINKLGSVISAYNANAGFEAIRKDSSDAAPAAKNVDKANFSSESKEKAVDSLKAEVKKAIESGASTERIQTLRDMIAKNEYKIAAQAVAAAIFEG